MAEASILRQIIEDVFIIEPYQRRRYQQETGKYPLSSTTNKFREIFDRFFWEYYGINTSEF